MRRNDTHQRQHRQGDDCIRGLVARIKKTTTANKRKAPEGERLRQMEMMVDGLPGRRVTKLHAMATGSRPRCTSGCHPLRNVTFQHGRVQLHLPVPLMPQAKLLPTREKTERQLRRCYSDGQMPHKGLIKGTQSAQQRVINCNYHCTLRRSVQ